MSAKLNVIVIYGGRSAEHEISCRSAAFILRNLDPAKYNVKAIAVSKEGRWLPQPTLQLSDGDSSVPIDESASGLPAMVDRPGSILHTDAESAAGTVVFPVVHGTFGEDGSMQGLFELADVAYVGADHYGSAIGMDKDVTKNLAQAAGIPVVPWVRVRTSDWADNRDATKAAIAQLGLPLFVKPARLGSSVGVTKVSRGDDLDEAMEGALRYDDKVIVETAVDAREIELAVLGGSQPDVSIPGEVMPTKDFYSYEAKYLDEDGARMAIPADLTPEQTEEARRLALATFSALDLYGMARIDLFLERTTNKFYLNEVNTIPGFTEISQYPMLWNASGVNARRLLDRLIESALERKQARSRLQRTR